MLKQTQLLLIMVSAFILHSSSLAWLPMK